MNTTFHEYVPATTAVACGVVATPLTRFTAPELYTESPVQSLDGWSVKTTEPEMAPAPVTPVTLAVSLSRIFVAIDGVAGPTTTCSTSTPQPTKAVALFWSLPLYFAVHWYLPTTVGS